MTKDDGTGMSLLMETIDSLAPTVSQVSNSFDQGDVYATDWQELEVPLPSDWQGSPAVIEFRIRDAGDSKYDSAVLIDDVHITGCN